MNKMNQKQLQVALKQVDYIERWALACFAAFGVQLGWLVGRIEVGDYSILTLLGAGSTALLLSCWIVFARTAYTRIAKLEKNHNGR